MRLAFLWIGAGIALATGSLPAWSATVDVCNGTSETVSLAVGYMKGSEWMSEGWWELKPKIPGQRVCARNPFARAADNGALYIYARSSSAVWGKARPADGMVAFCVKDGDTFTTKDSRPCPAGHEQHTFVKIETDGITRGEVQIQAGGHLAFQSEPPPEVAKSESPRTITDVGRSDYINRDIASYDLPRQSKHELTTKNPGGDVCKVVGAPCNYVPAYTLRCRDNRQVLHLQVNGPNEDWLANKVRACHNDGQVAGVLKGAAAEFATKGTTGGKGFLAGFVDGYVKYMGVCLAAKSVLQKAIEEVRITGSTDTKTGDWGPC